MRLRLKTHIKFGDLALCVTPFMCGDATCVSPGSFGHLYTQVSVAFYADTYIKDAVFVGPRSSTPVGLHCIGWRQTKMVIVCLDV